MRMIMSSRLLCRVLLVYAAAVAWLGSLPMSAAWGAADTVAYQGNFPVLTPFGLTQTELAINGENRDLLIYRPSGGSQQPVLILFSGTGGTLDYNIADELGRDTLRSFADLENVIIAVPIQRVMSLGDWDNHSAGTPYWETAVGESTSSALSGNPDTNPDLLFTRAIIKESSVAYGADLTRVYVNGFSNGAFFSYFVAATLSSRIAAFAETGGGLVLSQTTAGEPAACSPSALPAVLGAVSSCTEAGWSVGQCSTPGAIARPISPGSVVRVPPGFMEANDDDNTVPWVHTCNLANALPVSPAYQTRIVHSGNGHGMNGDYLDNSWNFMKNFRLTDSDRVFNWAEANFGAYFSPMSPVSQTYSGYYYRYYINTDSYLATKDGLTYYLLHGGDVTMAGALTVFMGIASGAGF